MLTPLDNLSFIKYQDLIDVGDGGKAMGNGDNRLVPGQEGDGLDDLLFAFRIGKSGCFIQHDNGSVAKDRPGNGNALALTAGKAIAPVTGMGVIPFGQLHDKIMYLGRFGRLDHFFIGGVRFCHFNVIGQRIVKKVGILKNKGHRIHQILTGHLPDIDPADGNGAFIDIPKTGQQPRNGTFTGPARSDKGGGCTGKSRETHAAQGFLFTVFIREVNVIESYGHLAGDFTPFHIGHGRHGENFFDTIGGGFGLSQKVVQPHERHEGIYHGRRDKKHRHEGRHGKGSLADKEDSPRNYGRHRGKRTEYDH